MTRGGDRRNSGCGVRSATLQEYRLERTRRFYHIRPRTKSWGVVKEDRLESLVTDIGAEGTEDGREWSWETSPFASISAGCHLSQPHTSDTLLLPSLAASDIRDASLRHQILKAPVPITPFAATRSYNDDTLRVKHGRSVCNAWIMWDQGMVWGCSTLSI